MGISKQCADPPPKNAILLPFSQNPKCVPTTGLMTRCAVWLDWGVEIFPQDIVKARIGYVPKALLLTILKAIDDQEKT